MISNASKRSGCKNRRGTSDEDWAGETHCSNCTLRATVLFAGLQQADFERVYNVTEQFTLTPGTILYRFGDTGGTMFTIRSGLIKQLKILPDGTQRILRLAQDTDVLGLETLVDDIYQHDAVAIHTTEVCSFPTKIIRQLSEENQVLRQELMMRWQKALKDADNWIVELSTGSAKARVARLILRIASASKSKTCELFSREDMGAMLGITTETASRTVAELKRQEVLRNIQLNTYAVDITRLQQIAVS